MALSNHERVGKALDLLRDGLKPFVEQELKSRHGDDWAAKVRDIVRETRLGAGKGESLQDVAMLLVVMDRSWGEVFRQTLGKADRSFSGACGPNTPKSQSLHCSTRSKTIVFPSLKNKTH